MLGSGDIDGLLALVDRKLALAARLDDAATRRNNELAKAGFEAGREGMLSWLSTLPATDDNQERWRELLAAAREARDINETNGKLIASRLQGNQQALAILTAAADQAATYGPDGHTKTATGGRPLGAA